MSIFLGVMPKDLDRLTPLMSLFFQQAIALQTDELPEHNKSLKHQVLMLLDEFPALGRLPILAKSAGFLPGYNVRTLMIMQSQSQLRDVYGVEQAKTLMKTIAARVNFAPKDMEDAEEISRELGNTTVKVRSVSKPGFGFFEKSRRSPSVSLSEQKRPLMLPQEVREMGAHRQIIFAENVRPILCHKIRYYLRPVFLRRVRPPPEVPTVKPMAPAPVAPVAPEADRTVTPAAGTQADTPTTARVAVTQELEKTSVVPPTKAEDQPLTVEELDTAVESFISAFKR
jgi:type IV secretion system protein VirD4